MKENKKTKVSFILNIIIAVLTLIATIIMFTGFTFMKTYDLGLEITKIGMLKLFTVQSNILMGIASLIFAYKEYQIQKGKIKELRRRDYALKLAGTTAVSLTFLVVFTYLGPLTEYGIRSMVSNSNLFYHLIIPILSVITFIFFEKNKKLDFKDTLIGLIPAVLYSLFYITNVITHIENGGVSTTYDWYRFVQNGIWTTIIVAPLILVITYLISI